MIAQIQEQLKAKQVVRFQGFGSKRTWGHGNHGDTITLTGQTGLDYFYPDEMVVKVAANTPLSELEALLAAQNHRLAFDPPHNFGLQSIGGVIAANYAGSRRAFRGGPRDHVLGISFINGKGELIKSGGRVMKNVSGLDLCRLFCGSWGTLGVLVDVTLKTSPIAKLRRSCLFSVSTMQEGLRLAQQASQSACDPVAIAFLPNAQMGFDQPVVIVELEGLEQAVDARSASLGRFLGRKADYLDGEQSALIWRTLCDAEPYFSQSERLWRIRTRTTLAFDIAQRIQAKELLFDWAGGLIWAQDPALELEQARAEFADQDVQITQIKGPRAQAAAAFHPPKQPALMRAVKAAFDPYGLLNPQRSYAWL